MSAPQYPHDQPNEDDEGELFLAVGREHGSVLINFYKPVRLIAMAPEQAMGLAKILVQHAMAVRAGAPDVPTPARGLQ